MTKRIVKLTEDDLQRLVKNVVEEVIENDEKFDDVLNNYEPFGDDDNEEEYGSEE